jgi:hypothetical protein
VENVSASKTASCKLRTVLLIGNPLLLKPNFKN